MHDYQPNRACGCARCRTRGLMGPTVLVTLGVLFLLQELHVVLFRTWPILLIVIGLVWVLSSAAGRQDHVAPGSQPLPPAPPPPTPPQPDSKQNPEQVDHV